MSTEAYARDIPGTTQPPDVEDTVAYRRAPAEFLASRRERYGDVFRHGPNSVFSGHPYDVHAVLTLAEPTPFVEIDLLGELPGTDQRPHQLAPARRVSSATVRPEAIAALHDTIDRALRGQLRALAGTEFDALAVLAKTCARAALPLCLHGPAPALVSASVTATQTMLEYVEDGRGLPRWLPNRRLRRAQATQQRLHEETWKVTLQRQTGAPANSPNTVLDHLRDDAALTRTNLPARILGTATAATTVVPGAALCWLMYQLGRRPDDAARIRAEALARPTRLGGCDLATRMPYTDAFVREVLRLHPPAWLITRSIDAPVQLGRYQLPAHQRVSFSPYLMHRDPRWWDEPELFAPERWLAPQSPHVPHAYLPFGASRFSAAVSTTLLTLAAAQLSAEYTVRVRHPDAVAGRFGAVLRPTRLRVRLDRRPAH
jgi:cytochrome P450